MVRVRVLCVRVQVKNGQRCTGYTGFDRRDYAPLRLRNPACRRLE